MQPTFREIGELGNFCPSCRSALAKRPGRKTSCPACKAPIYVRTRPLDNARVLVNEAGAAQVEADWAKQYQVSQQQPRPVSPEWSARIDEAKAAGPDPDPAVERAAQALFAELLIACETEAPRDARDRLLAAIADANLRTRVERRVWQLQVQSM